MSFRKENLTNIVLQYQTFLVGMKREIVNTVFAVKSRKQKPMCISHHCQTTLIHQAPFVYQTDHTYSIKGGLKCLIVIVSDNLRPDHREQNVDCKRKVQKRN